MVILGLTGPIGHGKSTFADELAKVEPTTRIFETSGVIGEVVDAWHQTLDHRLNPDDVATLNEWLQYLPDVLHRTLGVICNFEQIRIDPDAVRDDPVMYEKLLAHAAAIRHNPDIARHAIAPETKASYRPILQWLGGYLVARIDPSIWYNELAKRIKAAETEGCGLCIVGGVRYPNDAAILREIEAKIVSIYRPSQDQDDTHDPTERERDAIAVDCTVINDGTTEDLYKCGQQFLDDIRRNRLATEYSARTYHTKQL